MTAILYYAPSVLFIIGLAIWLYVRSHRRNHLFVVHCPLCRRDDYRMAIVAEQLGLAPEGEMLARVQQEEQTDD